MNEIATAPTSATNQTASKASKVSPDAIKAKANEVEAQVSAELNALDTATAALEKAIAAIGPLGLEKLAIRVGQSVNAQGRPAFGPWLTYTNVLAHRKVDFKTTDRLHAIARKNVPENVPAEKAEKFVKSKGKGSSGGKASCTLTMLAPVAWDIALGA